MVQFRLLGSIQVTANGHPVDPGRPRQRAVFAAMLVDAGQVVPRHTLVERVWGDAPPDNAAGTLRAHIARIRHVLSHVDAAGREPVRLVHEQGGYLLHLDRQRVDLHRFRSLVADARDTARSDAERLVLLRDAVELWRGEALTGVAGDWADRMRSAWARERIAATVAWAEEELRAGNPAAVDQPVRSLAEEHPLAESLVAVLMRATVAAGRPAEALEHYDATRRRLAGELGVDPSMELRAVYEAILRGAAEAPLSARVTVVPAQLPADVHGFVGREAEARRLDALTAGSHGVAGPGTDAAPAPVVVVAVTGTVGVGKTALAIRWGHHARDRFSDGQLYVDLRGCDQGGPLDTADALAGFLHALGVPSAEIPPGTEERAAQYRSELADRRMLIVLDNAATVEQVRPLLPGTGSSVVVVTSRDSLAGLVALYGAHRLNVDLLTQAEATALLRELVGDRIGTEPVAAAALVEQCARLPRALRVAAEFAAARADVALADVVAELADERRRPSLPDAGRARRAVVSRSERRLPVAAARAFRLLGLHPGPDVDPYALAAPRWTAAIPARRTADRR